MACLSALDHLHFSVYDSEYWGLRHAEVAHFLDMHLLPLVAKSRHAIAIGLQGLVSSSRLAAHFDEQARQACSVCNVRQLSAGDTALPSAMFPSFEQFYGLQVRL